MHSFYLKSKIEKILHLFHINKIKTFLLGIYKEIVDFEVTEFKYTKNNIKDITTELSNNTLKT